jgi:protein-L-isoaspartate O-methyltransferase
MPCPTWADAVVVTCGADHVPEPLWEQLYPAEVLVIAVGDERGRRGIC